MLINITGIGRRRKLLYIILLLLSPVMLVSCVSSPQSSSSAIYQMPERPLRSRLYSYENRNAAKGEGGKKLFGRKGSAWLILPAGESITLADIKGSGTIRRIWFVMFKREPKFLRGMKIEMYWDGAKTPAVEGPIGDFFGHTMGNMVAFQNQFFSSPGARTFVSTVPMPFRESARVVVTNETDELNVVYYELSTTEDDNHGNDMLYFHSFWRRENPTELRRDMTILPRIEGKGLFLGCLLGIRMNSCCNRDMWWGEGEVKMYLDGDSEFPTIVGTGTEDYVGDGYGLPVFNEPYQGCSLLIEQDPNIVIATSLYRFHTPDPIYFYKDIRVTIQVMGGYLFSRMLEVMDEDPTIRFMKAGDGTEYYTREELKECIAKDPGYSAVVERTDDYCSTAYWYMDSPENQLGPIAELSERLADLP